MKKPLEIFYEVSGTLDNEYLQAWNRLIVRGPAPWIRSL